MFSLLVWRFLYFFRIIYCLCAVFLSFLVFVVFLCCLSVVFYVCFRGTFFHDVLYKPVSDGDLEVVVAYIYRACVGHLYCACAVSFAYIIMLYAC